MLGSDWGIVDFFRPNEVMLHFPLRYSYLIFMCLFAALDDQQDGKHFICVVGVVNMKSMTRKWVWVRIIQLQNWSPEHPGMQTW